MEPMPRCPECKGTGSYYTEWSDSSELAAANGTVKVLHRPEPPDGTVDIECTVCNGSGIKPLVDDLADVLTHVVVGWDHDTGIDLAQHPDVQRVMSRYRAHKGAAEMPHR